jgi:hypothetical protein
MTEVDQDQNAYREGLFARALGRACNSNPYPEHSKDAVLWIHGWWLTPAAASFPPVARVEPISPSELRCYDSATSGYLASETRQIRYCATLAIATVRTVFIGVLLSVAAFALTDVFLSVFLP